MWKSYFQKSTPGPLDKYALSLFCRCCIEIGTLEVEASIQWGSILDGKKCRDFYLDWSHPCLPAFLPPSKLPSRFHTLCIRVSLPPSFLPAVAGRRQAGLPGGPPLLPHSLSRTHSGTGVQSYVKGVNTEYYTTSVRLKGCISLRFFCQPAVGFTQSFDKNIRESIVYSTYTWG